MLNIGNYGNIHTIGFMNEATFYDLYASLDGFSKSALERFSKSQPLGPGIFEILSGIITNEPSDNFGLILSQFKFLTSTEKKELINETYGSFRVFLRFLDNQVISEDDLARALNSFDVSFFGKINDYLDESQIIRIARSKGVSKDLRWLTYRFIMENPVATLEGVLFKASSVGFESRNDVLAYPEQGEVLKKVLGGRFDLAWTVVGSRNLLVNNFNAIVKGLISSLKGTFSTSLLFSCRAALRVADINKWGSSDTAKLARKIHNVKLGNGSASAGWEFNAKPWSLGYFTRNRDLKHIISNKPFYNSEMFGYNAFQPAYVVDFDTLIFHDLDDSVYERELHDTFFDVNLLSHPKLNHKKVLLSWFHNIGSLTDEGFISEFRRFKVIDYKKDLLTLALISKFYHNFCKERDITPSGEFSSILRACMNTPGWGDSLAAADAIFKASGIYRSNFSFTSFELEQSIKELPLSARNIRKNRFSEYDLYINLVNKVNSGEFDLYSFMLLLSNVKNPSIAFEAYNELLKEELSSKTLETVIVLSEGWELSGKDLVSTAKLA